MHALGVHDKLANMVAWRAWVRLGVLLLLGGVTSGCAPTVLRYETSPDMVEFARLAFNQSGTLLASGDSRGTVAVWSPPGHRPVWMSAQYDSGIRALMFDESGAVLLAVDDSRTLAALRSSDGQPLWRCDFRPKELLATRASGHDDSAIVLCVLSGGEIQRRRLHDGQIVAHIQSAVDFAAPATLSGDGSRLAAVDRAGIAYLVDAATGEPCWRFENPSSRIRGLQFSPDGNWLAGTCNNGTLLLWEAASGALRRRFVGDDERAPWPAARFSPDSARLAWFAGSTTVVAAVRSGDVVATIDVDHHANGTQLVFAPDSTRLALIMLSGMHSPVWLADLRRPGWARFVGDHRERVLDCVFSSDGHTLATASGFVKNPQENSIKLWPIGLR